MAAERGEDDTDARAQVRRRVLHLLEVHVRGEDVPALPRWPSEDRHNSLLHCAELSAVVLEGPHGPRLAACANMLSRNAPSEAS